MENVKKYFSIALTILRKHAILKQSFRKEVKIPMKINFLGDSITQGAGASCEATKYVSVVGQILNCEVRNYGIGGTRIAKQTLPSDYDQDFLGRIDKMNNACDIVIIFGGTNDFGHGDAPLGEMEDDTEYTFYGALKSAIRKVKEKYPNSYFMMITPLHRTCENNPKGEGLKQKESALLSEYVAAIKEVTNIYNIPTLDLFNDKDFKLDNPFWLSADGVHPNDEGHRLLGEKIYDFLRNQ